MSSTGAAAAAGGSGGLSTLSTSLLAAACTAVLAAAIFVAVALRRYLRAKKRRSLRPVSPAPASAASIYAQHVKEKSISTEDIGEPHLSFAPERAHNAQHDLAKMSLAQRTALSMRQQNFFPTRPFPSPKFPKAALLSPRLQPPASADLPPPRTPRTPKSPGLTELTMSPGPSILLKPLVYGKSPRIPSPSPSTASTADKKKASPEQKKKLTRSAVPSMLLRSLGVLPDFTTSSSNKTLKEEKETLADEEKMTSQDDKDADEPSLTPILDLGIDFGSDESFEKVLQLREDFSFDQPNALGLASSQPAQEPAEEKKPAMSAGMQSLIEALSPAQPETATLPSFKTSPPSKLSALPYSASTRSQLPTPPPSAGLPPAPTSAPMHKMPSSGSLQSKSSHATAASAASSVPDSFHSATGSIGQICINMPPIDSAPSPRLGSDDEQSSYRPLSLGLGPAKSPSQGTFTNILNGLRKVPSRNQEVDLEAGNSSIDESSTSRSFSSDAMSYSSSQTSVDLEANSSIGKANVVPAASVPPLPPVPLSLKMAGDRTPKAVTASVFADEDNASSTEVVAPRQTRKRASTLGALDRPKLAMPDLMHPRAAPLPPSDGMSAKMASPSIHIESVQVNRASIMNLKAKSTDHLPLSGSGKNGAAMNFASPYHRTLIPDPPMDGAHLSPGLGADSPILAQLSPKLRGNSPSFSPKPGFAESLKARLSLSRKSLTSSPGLTSRNSTPRMSTINQFPKPNGDGFQSFADSEGTDGTASVAAAEATPKIGSSKQAKVPVRPATSPLLGQQDKEFGLGFSPAILFNGQEVEPTKPLRFKKPSSAGGRLGASPQSIYSAASPSPMLHTGQWGTLPGSNVGESPLIASNDAALSPSGEHIEFGVASSPSLCDTPAAPALKLQNLPSTSATASPEIGEATPRPTTSSDAGAFADEDESQHFSYRDSVISVAASTMSIMSNSTCMSDAMGEDLDHAADRRTKLLASVQMNLAKAKAKDAKRDSQAAQRFRKSQMSQSSSLRNIPEEVSGGVQTMGLGLFESEDEPEEEEEDRETLADSPPSSTGRGFERKKPNSLVLMPHRDSRLAEPLTPPLTPVDATAAPKESRHAPTPSTSSVSSYASSAASVPRRMRPSQRRLAPIDTASANRLSPYPETRDGANSPSSLKLRPLSLAASLHGGDASPMKRLERPAFSPALSANIPSPVPAHVAGDRSSRYNEEGRNSRSSPYRQGGVLPTISSKGALETGRAGHAEPSLTHSDSSLSMGSMTSSLGSFSRMANFPSPVKSSFGYHGLGKAMGMRQTLGSRGSVMSDMPDMSNSTSVQSFASSTMTGGRLGYKTSDLSVAGM